MQRGRPTFALTAAAALLWGAGCDEFKIVAKCDDGFLNANETDVDCGDACGQTCALGKRCKLTTDCLAGACLEGFCAPSPPVAIWSELTNDGVEAPAPRQGHTLAYDPTSQAVLLFGGDDALMIYADTWQWNDQGWKSVDTTSFAPPARSNPTLVNDGKQLILFGGFSSVVPLEDLYTWNGSTWGPIMPVVPGPQARFQAAAAYDTDRAQLMLYGGYADTPLGDTWLWKNDGWTQSDLGGPPSRAGSTMVYDAARKRAVLFGGSADDQPLFSGLNDTWTWDGSTWVSQNKLEISPPPRYGAAMAYNSARRRVVLFGGMHEGVARSDTWEWNGTEWVFVNVEGPPARVGAAMAYDPIEGRVLLFGGSQDSLDRRGDIWEYHQLANPCSKDADCDAALFCVNGLCCDAQQCNGCEACNLPKNPGHCTSCEDACKDGVCGR